MANELYRGRDVGVAVPAVHLEAVNAVLVDGLDVLVSQLCRKFARKQKIPENTHMRRSQDGTVPVAHEQILAIFQPVTASFCAKTLFSFLQLLQQTKVPGDFGGHVCVRIIYREASLGVK